MRSLDINKANLDNQRNAVQEERRLRRRQPALRPDLRAAPASRPTTIPPTSTRSSARWRISTRRRSTTWRRSSRPTTRRTTPCCRSSATSTRRRRWRSIEKYFGVIARQPDPKRPDLARAAAHGRAPQHDRRSAGAPAAGRHRVDRAAGRRPPTSTRSTSCRDVLSSGRSSRLNQVVVREKQLAIERRRRSIRTSAARGCSQASRTVAPGKNPADVEAAIYEEIEKVKNGPIADWEIEKAHNNARRAAGRRR